MRKLLLSLSLFVMTMMTAMAQYQVNVTSDPENNYYSGDQSFAPADIATALGFSDPVSLQEFINAGGNVYIKTADGTSNAYTGGTNEFWMNADGVAQGYGDEGSCWFVGLSYDVEEGADPATGVVDIYMGQMPKYFAHVLTPSTLKTTIYLINGEKQVAFHVTLNVNEGTPETVVTLSGLNIVKEYSATLDFVVGKQYEGKSLSIEVPGMAEALGISADELSETIMERVYAQTAINTAAENEEAVWERVDELKLPIEMSDGWFGHYNEYNESTGVETIIRQNALFKYGTFSTFYLQQYGFAEDVFTVGSYGQFPNELKEGDNDYAELFVVNEGKAVKITFTTNVHKPEAIPFEEMTLAGESTIEIEAQVDNNYATKPFTVDMAAILEAIEADGVDDVLSWASEGELSDNHTEGSGGFYYNEQGYIDSWGSNAAFFIAKGSLENGEYSIGQMSGHHAELTEPVTYSADLVFLGAEKYYIVHVNYTVTPEKIIEDPFTKVAEDFISMQIVPNDEGIYEWETKYALDMDFISTKLGTTDFTLYTDVAKKAEDSEETTLEFSKTYNCNPAPGFWYGNTLYENSEHQNVVTSEGWGNNSFGLTYANGQITFYQYPGQRAVGDQFLAHLYAVNEATAEYIDYTVSVKYVEEVAPEAEIVGREGVKMIIGEYSEYLTTKLDMTKAYEALGIDEETIDASDIIAAKSPAIFDKASLEDMFFFNANGYAVGEEDESAVIMLGIRLNPDTDEPELFADLLTDDIESISDWKSTIGIEYDGKRYIFDVTYGTEDDPTGIISDFIDAVKNNIIKAIYSIDGILRSKLEPGINIVTYADGSKKKIIFK